MKESIREWSGCLMWLIGALFVYGGCNWYLSRQEETRFQKLHNDSIVKARIADSLAHDPSYQDSIRRVKMEWQKWKQEENELRKMEIVGFMMYCDTVYHNTFHFVERINNHLCGYIQSQRDSLLFITNNDIETNNFVLCEECKEKEKVLSEFEDGELIRIDDIEDYLRDNE